MFSDTIKSHQFRLFFIVIEKSAFCPLQLVYFLMFLISKLACYLSPCFFNSTILRNINDCNLFSYMLLFIYKQELPHHEF